ncbi:hypothetical protein QAD02_018279, partial [Eretmocerus hayati]
SRPCNRTSTDRVSHKRESSRSATSSSLSSHLEIRHRLLGFLARNGFDSERDRYTEHKRTVAYKGDILRTREREKEARQVPRADYRFKILNDHASDQLKDPDLMSVTQLEELEFLYNLLVDASDKLEETLSCRFILILGNLNGHIVHVTYKIIRFIKNWGDDLNPKQLLRCIDEMQWVSIYAFLIFSLHILTGYISNE